MWMIDHVCYSRTYGSFVIHPSGEFLAVSPDAALCLNVKTPDTLAVFG